MKAVILAAGRGSRMRSLTESRPKCLVELGGRTLLSRQLQALREGGISEIAIVTGYQRGLLEHYNLLEFHNPRWASTNMVASLACAEAWLMSEACIVSYSDIFYGPKIVRSLASCEAEIAVAYDPNWLGLWQKRFGDALLDAETFALNLDHTLKEIGMKPHQLSEMEGQYMGLLRFTPKGWTDLEAIRAKLPDAQAGQMQMTRMLHLMLERGYVIPAVANMEPWGEIDSESDLDVYGDFDASAAQP